MSTAEPWPPWACPDTGDSLELRNGEHAEAVLARPGDPSLSYPIVNGIPRFVGQDNYADSFGLQWNRFRETQLDSHTGIPWSRDRLRRCLGQDLWRNLAGSHLLECGCGAGRFTEVLLQEGAFVTSIDLSSAVDANSVNCPLDDRHRIAQADITKLPFAPQQFDIVLCLGVVQHTPNPEHTIEKLFEHVRPGGWLVIDHYTHHAGRWTSLKPLFRAYLKRQSPETAFRMVSRLVDLFYPWHLRFRNSSLAWTALCRVSPLTTYLRSEPELSGQLQRDWCQLDTHDSLTDWFKWLRTKEQIRDHLVGLGSTNISTEYAGNGVEARCQRPA